MKQLCLALALACILTTFAGCASSQETPEATRSPTEETTPLHSSAPPERTFPSAPIATAPLPDNAIPLDDTRPDVTLPSVWIAHCEQQTYLWNLPYGSILTAIPRGAKMQLLAWDSKHAKVIYDGSTGYVLTSQIVPEDTSFLAEALKTVQYAHFYSYDKMLEDLQSFQTQYPDIVEVETIGASVLGKEIPVMRIGDPDAAHHILLQGSMHGREYANTWLLMAMADYWLGSNYREYPDMCIHIIPMVNPDGVAISQTGVLNDEQTAIYYTDMMYGFTDQDPPQHYALRWKANGQGVDINRNFPSGWARANELRVPSSENYRGPEPFSTPEAAALRDYTLRYPLDATLSYHTRGSVIYWFYGSNAKVNAQSLSLGLAVETVTKYPLMYNVLAIGAGYKDWAMDALGIPSLTVEVGCGEAPFSPIECYSAFLRHYKVLPTVAQWVRQQQS